MAAIRLILFALTFLLLTSCTRDPHGFRVTEKNKDTFLEEVKDTKGFTVDEVRLLIAYEIRGGIGRTFGGQVKNPVGKTLGELIDEARKDAATEKTAADSQKRLADQARAKEEAAATELRKSLNLTVYEKGFLPADASASRFQSYITLRCAYQNTSAKDIRAFKGTVVFEDLFGAPIYRVTVTISNPVGTGSQAKWDGLIEYNQFVAIQGQLRNAELKDMHVTWLPSSVIFADGTKIGD